MMIDNVKSRNYIEKFKTSSLWSINNKKHQPISSNKSSSFRNQLHSFMQSKPNRKLLLFFKHKSCYMFQMSAAIWCND